jgi:hypothetical protein
MLLIYDGAKVRFVSGRETTYGYKFGGEKRRLREQGCLFPRGKIKIPVQGFIMQTSTGKIRPSQG